MFAALFLLRIPAAFVMALVGFSGIAMVTSVEAALSIAGTEMWSIFSNYGLTVIPLFILVGEIVHYAGYNFSVYDATYKWFGHFRGGLAMTTIMASAAFSAISGSNTATAATMSAVAIPAMKEYKYHPLLNAGAVSAGATLGVLIPPSLVLVVYGLCPGQSIGEVFVGNIVPSVLLPFALRATVACICRLHPEWGAAGPRFGWKERFKALPEAVDILVLFGIIMYALFTGVVTATEAAAVSCFLAYAICIARGKLSWKKFTDSMKDTLRISCMVFMIVAGAVIFARFLTLTRLPFEIAEWIGALTLPRWMVLWLILLCYIVGGCVMDALAFLLVSLPIFYPLVLQLGYDPIWFAQAVTIVTTMGAIMPPIGICCYVVSGMSGIPLGTVFRGCFYYFPAYVVSIAILMIFPHWTVTALSDLVR
jgi:tripartite ATP-independent transporter DctM subunit